MNYNKEIQKTFYGQIIPEASRGRVYTDFTYNIGFNTTILESNKEIYGDEQFPTLMIKNIKLFNEALNKYLQIAINFYCEDEYEIDSTKVKKILSLLWGNATSEDFNNPIEYVNRYTNFIKDKTLLNYLEPQNIGYSEILLSNIEIQLKYQKEISETPYALYIRLFNYYDNQKVYYDLPVVKLGISNNTGYIYSIQKNKSLNYSSDDNYNMLLDKYQKKTNRQLYKVNENFIEQSDMTDNIENPENMTGITPSTLLSLAIAVSLLNNQGISKIKVPDYLPIRWQAKELVYEFKSSIKSEQDREEYLKESEEDHDLIMRNITDKLIRTIRRLEYHFNNITIEALPKDVDDCTHIKVDNNIICNNPLLNEVYNLANNKTKSKKI
jgi:hypothetical protein